MRGLLRTRHIYIYSMFLSINQYIDYHYVYLSKVCGFFLNKNDPTVEYSGEGAHGRPLDLVSNPFF